MTPQQFLSTAAASGLLPATDSPLGWAKTLVSFVLGTVGFVLLGYGKKTDDVEKMILGGALTIASFFFF